MRSSGLSPLARGNLRHERPTLTRGGPIPARAGKPRADYRIFRRFRAYPRSRGETLPASISASAPLGLSPLARGNRSGHFSARTYRGPIPARAGKPFSRSCLHPRAWAYPRSRGETQFIGQMQARRQGLSPLARGNRLAYQIVVRPFGPIPARAGKPWPISLRSALLRAYPRSRGETHVTLLRLGCLGAYPRSRGETPLRFMSTSRTMGLSPLARGNRENNRHTIVKYRPIPARAGKPLGT